MVQANDQPHRGRLPGTVRAEEAGDLPGMHGERDIVDRSLLSITHGQAVGLDYRWGSFIFVGRYHPEARGSADGLVFPPLAALDRLEPLPVRGVRLLARAAGRLETAFQSPRGGNLLLAG